MSDDFLHKKNFNVVKPVRDFINDHEIAHSDQDYIVQETTIFILPNIIFDFFSVHI